MKRGHGLDQSRSVALGLQQSRHDMALIAADPLRAFIQRDISVLKVPEPACCQAPPFHVGRIGSMQRRQETSYLAFSAANTAPGAYVGR